MNTLDLIVAPVATTITVCAHACEVVYDSLAALLELLYGLVAATNEAPQAPPPSQQAQTPSPSAIGADMLTQVGGECAALASLGYDGLCLAGNAILPTAKIVVNCIALGADSHRGRLSWMRILAFLWGGVCEGAKLVRIGADAGYLSFVAYDPLANTWRGLRAFKNHVNGSPLMLAGVVALLALRTTKCVGMWFYNKITN